MALFAVRYALTTPKGSKRIITYLKSYPDVANTLIYDSVDVTCVGHSFAVPPQGQVVPDYPAAVSLRLRLRQAASVDGGVVVSEPGRGLEFVIGAAVVAPVYVEGQSTVVVVVVVFFRVISVTSTTTTTNGVDEIVATCRLYDVFGDVTADARSEVGVGFLVGPALAEVAVSGADAVGTPSGGEAPQRRVLLLCTGRGRVGQMSVEKALSVLHPFKASK